MTNYIRRLAGAANSATEIIANTTTDLANVKINSSIRAGAVAIVGNAFKFHWDPTSTASSGVATIVPLDGSPGRWLADTTSATVNTVVELRNTIPTNDNAVIDLLGHTTLGDGGEGEFYWDAAATDLDNDRSIITPGLLATGRWKRKFTGPVFRNVTLIDDSGGSTYAILSTDDLIAVGTISGAGMTLTLPAAPHKGDYYEIKDIVGTAATKVITMDGNGNNIDANSTYPIDQNYASLSLIFTTRWSVL